MPVSILDRAARRRAGGQPGITSVCSAHPFVIEPPVKMDGGGC